MRVMFWAACSLALLSCAHVQRPDADLCVVNAPGKKLTCYNIKTDFNDDGQIRPGVPAHYKPAPDLEAINKWVITDLDSWAKIKAYVKLLREEYERRCERR